MGGKDFKGSTANNTSVIASCVYHLTALSMMMLVAGACKKTWTKNSWLRLNPGKTEVMLVKRKKHFEERAEDTVCVLLFRVSAHWPN